MKWLGLCVFSVMFVAGPLAWGQRCPDNDPNGPSKESTVREIDGLVILHDGIRRWVEMRPDVAVCGNTSIQLLAVGRNGYEDDEKDAHLLERLRGCYIAAHGRLGIPGTGYYSAELYMNVEKFAQDAGCVLKPSLPDYSHLRPPKTLRRYRVILHVHYRGDGKVAATIVSGKRAYTPWQAYASYFLTGEYGLYGFCAKGFGVSAVSGTPEAKPDWVEQAIMFPESAAANGVWNTTLRYTCSR